MKNRSLYLLIIIFLTLSAYLSASAQVVTTDPAFPTEADSVVIIFDASQGNGELFNVAPPIYAHTGVITNLSSGPSAWRYVIAGWSQNTDKARMTPLGNNKYKLVIKPTIRSFYNVPASEEILQMAFVFRNADGSKVGRNSDGSDIFANVYAPGVQVVISSPTNGSIVQLGETVIITASASEADSMFIFLNSNLLVSTAGNNISHSITASQDGTQWIRATAKSESEAVSDSVYFFVRGATPVAELPAGLMNGINYIDHNTVTLVLHDPPALKQFVFVIGDFNNWMVNENYFMNRTPDGTKYWLTINNLIPGKEYIFQYHIDGQLRLADPYTHKVSDPWHDKWIPETTYPGLIQYPEGKTFGIASVLQTAQQPYNWQVNNFTPPAISDLVIYELHIRDFVATRDIKTLIDTLDYLERLGVNAIELMPINEFEGNDSWGYNPSFYFATDKAYGRQQDYKQFIDECHKRGIAVIIDMVLNHSYGQSPLVQMYFDPNAGQWGQPAASNPWYNQVCPHEPWCWGYDFNHLSPYTQAFVDRVNAYWLTEFKVDGFRFDFTKGFTNQQTGNQGSNYDAARVAILKRMADEIWKINPKAYVILEHFAENAEEKVLAEYGMLIWGNMNYSYNEATMGWISNSNISGISYKNRGWNAPHLVGYMESHDEERLVYKNITYGNSSNTMHNVKDTTIALKRIETAANLFFTIPGPKMIWQFGELGYDYSIDYNCRVCPKPIRWDYLEDERRASIYNVFSELIALRKEHDVFRTTDFTLVGSGAIKRVTLLHSAMDVVAISNFGVQASQSQPVFPKTGWWYEFYSGDSINVSDLNYVLDLDPAEYRLYSTKKLIDRPAMPAGNTVKIFPNPIGNLFNIQFYLKEDNLVKAELFSIHGRKVAELFESEYRKGSHNVQYARPNHISSGIYVLKILFGSESVTRKIIIL